jgi:hypothetical protein
VVAHPKESTDIRNLFVKIIDVDSLYLVVPVTSPDQEANFKAPTGGLVLQNPSNPTAIHKCKTSENCSRRLKCTFSCRDGVCVLSKEPEQIMMSAFCKAVLLCELGPSLFQAICGTRTNGNYDETDEDSGIKRTASTPKTLREMQERILTLL